MPTLSLGVLLIFRQSSGPVGREPERFQDGRTGADKDFHLQFLLAARDGGAGVKAIHAHLMDPPCHRGDTPRRAVS
jgi:hypothetical protein